MKIARFEVNGEARLGIVKQDGILDLPLAGEQQLRLEDLLVGGASALERIASLAERVDAHHAIGDVRLLAPIRRPGKYLAIGMNYAKHIVESEKLGVAEPTRQFWFNKQTTCIVGPYDDIEKPSVSEKVDYEVELGVIIGKPAKRVQAENACEHIFGYFVANDVSTRDWQFHSPTFTMGKSFDTHGPIGPWIVTADEVADCHDLDLRCYVNGELRQSSNTSQMVHNVFDQIAYLSTAFTLEAGDLIATGTPEGVGVAMSPPTFLAPGDVVRCEIDGIGAIENTVVAE